MTLPRKRRGLQKHPNWEAIEADFVESPVRKSTRMLEAKYGIDHTVIHRHMVNGHWEERREAYRDKVRTKREQKTSTIQAEEEARQIEIANGIAILHGYRVQEWHDQLREARKITNPKKRAEAVGKVLSDPDFLDYLKVNNLDKTGRYLKFMHGEPDSKTVIEGLILSDDADAVKKLLLDLKLKRESIDPDLIPPLGLNDER
jgi:hypothetical protein